MVLRRFCLVLLTLLLLLPAARGQDSGVVGVWLSPDWVLPGTKKYSEEEVRKVARKTLGKLAEAGVNTVFLETWLRGYSIAPSVQKSGQVARPGTGIPTYPHLTWKYQTAGDEVLDTLQIFIDEGRQLGLEVHAWTHCFYWKMDNTEAMLPWHNAPGLWSGLVVNWLKSQAERLKDSPGAAPDTLALMREAAQLMEKTTDSRELEKVLKAHHLNPEGRPLGILVRQALRAGAERPGFLLMNTVEDPFPAPRAKQLRPVYVNPADPQVREILLRVLGDLVDGHPGLAGLHLDHVRYPVDGQGMPEGLEIQDGTYNYYNAANPNELARYQKVAEQLRTREEALRTLVDQLRVKVGPHRKLSAAVLPSYYRERDNGRYRIGGYDFSSQDWYSWKVDFVVPMLYYYHPYVIRNMLGMWTADLEKRYGSQTIQVYPGISAQYLGRSGQLSVNNWVYFDLKLSRDVKLEHKEDTEDLDFGPE